MGSRGLRLFVAALGLLGWLLPNAAAGNVQAQSSDVELVGFFYVGSPLGGAALSDDYLYVTTNSDIYIYDVSAPLDPQLLSSAVSERTIHGELLPTNDRILLLTNTFLTSSVSESLQVWDVENKSDPALAETLNVHDEHVGCVLACRWAYGSEGTVVDLRRPGRRTVRDEDWLSLIDSPEATHRVDEVRPGLVVAAPNGIPPYVMDVRRPLKPKVVAKAKYPRHLKNQYLYSHWPNEGRDRFLFSSVEFSQTGSCSDRSEGALLAFDTKGWPKEDRFPLAGRYTLGGNEDSGCGAYYMSFHPDFDDGGLVVLPYRLEGARVLEVGPAGKIEEVGFFKSPVASFWHAFWIDDEIFYALNQTGEVYILRYVQ